MKHDTRPPFRSLRDVVLKELKGKKSLLCWNDDPSFARDTLDGILDGEAYILDRYAHAYLRDLAMNLTVEDYFLSIANTRMPFPSVWVEAIFDYVEDKGEITYGALVTDEGDGIKVFQMQLLHESKPWLPTYCGTEVVFHRDGNVSCSKTPISKLYERMAEFEGISQEDHMNSEIEKALRIGGVFAVLCAALARPKILDRDAPRPLRKSEAKAFAAANRRAPRFAPSIIRLSKAGRAERDVHQASETAGHSVRTAHWVRGHLFLARNKRLTWRRAHVRGGGDPMERVHYVTE
ncbi:hypothetical protein [uncultured Paracoccus sp.]|uniref:hypothetical protein n=1 Tax=uncultured Paracoccus sp. TaxID=189685 RepID=UPI00262D047D|nr:hypothetical protein [uncultured Paracoccus sp.]